MPRTGPDRGAGLRIGNAPTTATRRPLIPVAAGCLINRRGEVLIAQRPLGKIAAGKWEFPGGKIEPGETARAALARELREELGIEIRQARPLIRVRHAYADRTVILDTWLVARFAGEPQPHDRQALAWVPPAELTRWDLLAADHPIVSALQLPGDYVFTRPGATLREILRGLEHIPSDALLRLRLPALSDAEYAAAAARVMPPARRAGLRVILDRAPSMAARLRADGWHAPARKLARARRSWPEGLLRLASCHDAQELAWARELGFHAAVLGPVRPTATHPDRSALGWRRFEQLAGDAGLPVYAIGGLQRRQRAQAFAHHAQGIAGISAYWD